MSARLPHMLALLMGFVLIAHAVLAYTKLRWVTATLELAAAAILFWQWYVARGATAGAPAARQA